MLALLLVAGGVSLVLIRSGAGEQATPSAGRASEAGVNESGVPTGGGSLEPSLYPSPESPTSVSPGVPSSSPSAEQTPNASQIEAQAKQDLADLADQGKQQVTLDSRWVSQLASKWIGITDPLQRTRSGSHTFKASDILAEHQALKNGDNAGARVFMLRSTDFGLGKRPDKKVLYVTFADGGFGSRNEARAWCEDRFPNLSGKRLVNTCLPTRLTPLHA